MKVSVLIQTFEYERQVQGVFSSHEKALDYRDRIVRELLEGWVLDPAECNNPWRTLCSYLDEFEIEEHSLDQQ